MDMLFSVFLSAQNDKTQGILNLHFSIIYNLFLYSFFYDNNCHRKMNKEINIILKCKLNMPCVFDILILL